MFKNNRILATIAAVYAAVLFLPTIASANGNGTQMLIWQGPNQKLGASVDDQAAELAKNDLVVISHGFTVLPSAGPVPSFMTGLVPPNLSFPNHHDCLDTGHPQIGELLSKTRILKPDIKIFVYVTATADRVECKEPTGAAPNCPGQGVCSNFMTWVDTWLAIEGKYRQLNLNPSTQNPPLQLFDGFFIDYFSSTAINAATRDNVLSYIKSKGKKAMVNILTPSYIKIVGGVELPRDDFVTFATSSPYLGAGDYVLMEGFEHSALGSTSVATTRAITEYIAFGLPRNIKLAALATRPAFLSIGSVLCAPTLSSPISPRPAYTKFVGAWTPGSVFQYTNSDLGTQQYLANGTPILGNDPVHCNNDLFNSLPY